MACIIRLTEFPTNIFNLKFQLIGLILELVYLLHEIQCNVQTDLVENSNINQCQCSQSDFSIRTRTLQKYFILNFIRMKYKIIYRWFISHILFRQCSKQ